MKCSYCGSGVDIPFKCPFCGGYFCPGHRLPENHACPELLRVRTRQPPSEEERHPPPSEVKPEPAEQRPVLVYPLRFKKAGWTNQTETFHLVTGTLIVMGVGLSIRKPFYEWVFFLAQEPAIFLASALVFAVVFVSHELAHKVAAKHYGLWAEFRLSLIGALLTLLSMVISPFKLIAPGAVMIAGAADRKIIGITALAGPLTSIVLTALFFALHFFVAEESLASMILGGATLGAWIALQNLIPWGILDGAKVYWWNKNVWVVSFSASLILTLIVLAYPFF